MLMYVVYLLESMKGDVIVRCQIVVAGLMSWSHLHLRCLHLSSVSSSSQCNSEIEEV